MWVDTFFNNTRMLVELAAVVFFFLSVVAIMLDIITDFYLYLRDRKLEKNRKDR